MQLWCSVEVLPGPGGEPAWLGGIEHSLTLDSTRVQRELLWRASRVEYRLPNCVVGSAEETSCIPEF